MKDLADWIVAGVQTVLLITILFYQRNRNRVLEERISEQAKTLAETNSLLTQQSTAIQGQSTIVDTAMRYASNFDTTKLEGILRREVEAQYQEEFQKLKGSQSSALEQLGPDEKAQIGEVARMTLDETFGRLAVPLSWSVIYLTMLSEEERQAQFSRIADPATREAFRQAFERNRSALESIKPRSA